MVNYRKAKKEELQNIAGICADSFAEYPLYNLINIQENLKNKFLYDIHLCLLKSMFDGCVVGIHLHEIVSAAIIRSPQMPKASIFKYILNGGIKLLFKYGFKEVLGFLDELDKANKPCDDFQNAHVGAWCLELLAVNKSHQSKGFGSKIINDYINPLVKQNNGQYITLITNKEANRYFYQKNGFTEFNELMLTRNNSSVGNWSYVYDVCLTPF